jgi:hypothetical protein
MRILTLTLKNFRSHQETVLYLERFNFVRGPNGIPAVLVDPALLKVNNRHGGGVLVQREMERGRSPLVSIPPFGRGFSRHRGLPIR